MDFLNIFNKSDQTPKLTSLPRGSFTVDSRGRIMSSTIPQSFPAGAIRDIGKKVSSAFHSARQAHMPLKELIIRYQTITITAREFRNGAIIFLAPKSNDLGLSQH